MLEKYLNCTFSLKCKLKTKFLTIFVFRDILTNMFVNTLFQIYLLYLVRLSKNHRVQTLSKNQRLKKSMFYDFEDDFVQDLRCFKQFCSIHLGIKCLILRYLSNAHVISVQFCYFRLIFVF